MRKNDFFQKSKKMRLPIPEEVLHTMFHMDITKIATCSLDTDREQRTDRQLSGGLLGKFTMIKRGRKKMISQNLIPKSLRDLDKFVQRASRIQIQPRATKLQETTWNHM